MDDDIPLTAQFAVSVQSRLETDWKHALMDAPVARKRDKGTTRFTLQPLDGVLANGLPDALILTSVREDRQVASTTLMMDIGSSSRALPTQLEIEPNAFRIIPIRPSHPFFRFTLKSDTSEAVRQIKPVATQFVTRVESPLIQSTILKVDVHSLYRDGVVFVDLWIGNQWVTTTTAQLNAYEASVELTLPAPGKVPKIAWIRAYRNAYMPGTARGGRHVVLSDKLPSKLWPGWAITFYLCLMEINASSRLPKMRLSRLHRKQRPSSVDSFGRSMLPLCSPTQAKPTVRPFLL